ncbi:MAG: nucleotide exchange factor GrpE [Deltaproteobacteria bacterium RIFCSPLOWO2_12_FULL_60_19]|nr:MAG: nucleotide exchange factor GrpE [Deltaproteobacteria bacterium RIFCSPLOWO2_12_FULL_60_19]
MDDGWKKANGEDQEETESAAGAEPGSPSAPGTETGGQIVEAEKLREQLLAKEFEAKENYDRLLRLAAEFENFKKRAAREKTDAIRYANESLLKDLLPILDNLERALEHAKGGGNGNPLLDGIELVLKSFLELLEKHGVTQISAVGELFDPGKHDALAQIETSEHRPNTVVEQHSKGYHLPGRLLRPAQVTVAKLPQNQEKRKEAAEVENEEADD